MIPSKFWRKYCFVSIWIISFKVNKAVFSKVTVSRMRRRLDKARKPAINISHDKPIKAFWAGIDKLENHVENEFEKYRKSKRRRKKN